MFPTLSKEMIQIPLQKDKPLTYDEIMAQNPDLLVQQNIDTEREAWLARRLGKITGSNFGKVTRAKGGSGWSEGAETYLSELIWEHVTGLQASDFSGSKQTEWGEMHEAEARRSYEKITRNTVVIGIFYPLEGFDLVGCTPDGVGEKGLEIKCPYAAKAHLSTILKRRVPSDYIDQVTGHILVTKRDGCDFVSYDPRFIGKRDDLATYIVEVPRNNFAVEELQDRLYDFEKELKFRLDKLEIVWKK